MKFETDRFQISDRGMPIGMAEGVEDRRIWLLVIGYSLFGIGMTCCPVLNAAGRDFSLGVPLMPET